VSNASSRKFEPKNNLLQVIVSDMNGVQIGVTYIHLSSLPKTMSESEQKGTLVYKELSYSTSTVQSDKPRILLEVTAEGFGCDARIYNKNQKISEKICGDTGIHSKKEPMKYCAIILENTQLFRGVTEALNYINTSQGGRGTNDDSMPRTVVLFEGKYLVEKPIKILKDNCILFGIDGTSQEGYVYLSRGRFENKNEYMFELGPDVKKFYLHNIRFNPKENIIKIDKGKSVQANLCVMGVVNDLNKDTMVKGDGEGVGLQESNHSWALEIK